MVDMVVALDRQVLIWLLLFTQFSIVAIANKFMLDSNQSFNT